MIYRLEGTTIEAIGPYVRVGLGNGQSACTQNECPEAVEVVLMLERLQGYPPNQAQTQACSRATADAQKNKVAEQDNDMEDGPSPG